MRPGGFLATVALPLGVLALIAGFASTMYSIGILLALLALWFFNQWLRKRA